MTKTLVERLREMAVKEELGAPKERGPGFPPPWGQDIIDARLAFAADLRSAASRIEELESETWRLRTERDEEAHRVAEYWKPIMRQRDEWIVELIRERDAARQALQDKG
jgi:hypothetical protein